MTPVFIGGGGLEFLRLSEATPDKNEETKLDGADAVVFDPSRCLPFPIETGVWDDGKCSVRVDDEAEALRLAALLLAARFASMLYAGVDGSTGLAESCGSSASGKFREDEGTRLLVEDEAVEVPNRPGIAWKDGWEGRTPSVAGSMNELVEELRDLSSSGLSQAPSRGMVGDEMVEGASMYIVMARGGGDTRDERSCGARRSWGEGR